MGKNFKNPWAKGGENYPDWRSEFDKIVSPSSTSVTAVKSINILVTVTKIGIAHTWTYPHDNGKTYEIPTYKMVLSGTDNLGRPASRNFEVIRFGVTRNSPSSSPYTVGLADKQTHVIKQWLPTYKVHSAPSIEDGAWQVYGDFLVHDGPDNPLTDLYASIGCIEVCRGPQMFNVFNDLIISYSGLTTGTREEKLTQIGLSKKLKIDYEKATRPPVIEV